jgi:hypothetical protein
MAFLNTILERPAFGRAFLILFVGFPAADAVVPQITKKSLEMLAVFV